MSQILFNRFNKTKLAACVVFMLVYVVGIELSGGSVFELLLFWFASVALLLLPGYAVYRILNIQKYLDGFTLPLCFTLGGGVMVALYCVTIRLSLLPLMWTALLVLFALGLFFLLNKRDDLSKRLKKPSGTAVLLIFISTALIFVYAFAGVAKYARPTAVGDILLNQDFLWNVGNAESFKLGFPPEDIRFYDVRLQYHYFTELLLSAFSTMTGISSYNLIAFYSQSLFLPVLIITLYLCAKKLYLGDRVRAALFPLSMFLLSCASLWTILPAGLSLFTNSMIRASVTNINSMSNAFVFTAVFLTLLFQLSTNKYRANLGIYLTLFGSFALLTFTKSPIAAIVALGVLAAMIATLIQRRISLPQIIISLAVGVGFFVIYTLNFSSGTNVSTGFHYALTLELGALGPVLNIIDHNSFLHKIWAVLLMLLQSVLISPFVVPIFFLSAIKSLKNFRSLSFVDLFLYAVGFGGLVAFFFFHHESLSQVYFLYVALFCINIVAIREFRFEKPSRRNLFNYSMLAISLVTSVFLYVNMAGSGLRQYLFNLDILPKHDYWYESSSAADERAGEFLRSMAQPDDMFATNRVYSNGGLLSNVYTAFSGMQCFMEGNRYTISNMGLSEQVANERSELNATLFYDESSYEEILAVCAEHGIDYLVYYDLQHGNKANMQGFEQVFADENVSIYKTGVS